MTSRSVSARRARPLLGTLVEIGATGAASTLADAIEAAFTAVDCVGRLMSFHDPASELSRVNRDAHRHTIPISEATYTVLARALEIAHASEGAFDPCVAPALVRLGFLPGIADARRACGWWQIELGADRTVRFRCPLALDLGGIAKGHAVDLAAQVLESHGVDDYCVNAGGDLRIGAQARPVDVRHPAEPRMLWPLGAFSRASVATSAPYFAARPGTGAAVHPIIAPATGEPAGYAGSISVVASECIDADALTKVVAVKGALSGALLERYGAYAYLFDEAGSCTRFPVRQAA